MKVFLVSMLLAVLPAVATAKTLYWSAFEVEARLDAEGVLHIRERQSMVFDGNWNGGERIFNIRPGQKLRFRRLARIDSKTGAEHQLERGNLSRLDRWNWESRHVLRWRSRLPSDPVFENETLIYLLEYELSGILERQGDFYGLDHDFAFPDRAGRIESFSLDLELDPVWSPPAGFETRRELTNLAPGARALVVAALSHRGSALPAAVQHPVAKGKVWALFAAVFCLIGLKTERLFRNEAAQGRFAPPTAPRPMTREWLDQNLFDLQPEEAGALWDHKIAAPEVAAVIARMVAEGKLASRVSEEGSWWKKPTMSLDLLVSRKELEGYQRKLVDKLFFGGRTTTDSKALRKHYRSTGLDPATAISAGLLKRLAELPGGDRKLATPSWIVSLVLFLSFGALLTLDGVTRGASSLGPVAGALILLAPLPTLWAYIAAHRYRNKLGSPVRGWLGFLVPLALLLLLCLGVAYSGAEGRRLIIELQPGIFAMLALAVFPLLIANSVLNQAQTRDRRAVIARRRALLEARRHLARQLKKPVPDLEDAWFPYILAFGLSRKADAWARVHGPGTSDWATRPGMTTGSGSRATSWSGGGGSFGGAGATAAWTAAATGMASGIPAPSSSGSGSSGGGSSGGSSGGGGGGGW